MSVEITAPQRTKNYEVWQRLLYPPAIDFSQQVHLLLDAAVKASSSHNTQPWGFRVEDKSILILPDLERKLPESDPTGREMYLSLGTALGNLKVAVRRFGWNPTTEYIKELDSEEYRIRVNLTPGYQPTQEDLELYDAINKRVNFDGDHKTTPLTAEVLATLQNIFIGQSNINLTMMTDLQRKRKIADLVGKGDKMIFNNNKFIQELVHWIRDATTKRGDGILTSVLNLPKEFRRNAARILMSLKQEMIANIVQSDKDRIRNSSAIGVISVSEENPLLWIQAGELYQLTALAAATKDVYFGARAVLIETGDLHQELEETSEITNSRAVIMFRAGYPSSERLEHAPRIPGNERVVAQVEGKTKVVSTDRPTIFRINEEYSLGNLLDDLGNVQVEGLAFSEHWLPDLFYVTHPDLNPRSTNYLEQQRAFVEAHDKDTEGVWVYNPHTRILKHLPNEDDFYPIRIASNRYLVSPEGQQRIHDYRYGIAGLSSGAKIAWALVKSGAKYLTLADSDYLSGPNQNRVDGQIGENKVYNLAWDLWEDNPFLELDLVYEGITAENVARFCENKDILIEQTDSTSKFFIRQHAKGPVIMVTALPDPVVDIEFPGEPMFGGRAEAASITPQTLEDISSIGESTAYIAVLIDPRKLTLGNWRNFIALVKSEANTYTQTGADVIVSGGVAEKLVKVLAEKGIEGLKEARSWIINTFPPIVEDSDERRRAMVEFINAYIEKFGSNDAVTFLQNSLN